MIRVSSLEKVYETAERDAVRALSGIDFQVEEGEFYVLPGPSGCGKSTTLRCIAGFEEESAEISGNMVRGEVQSVVFMGEMLDCTLALAGLDMRVKVHPSTTLAVGETVAVHVPPERCHAIAGTA